MRPNNCGEIFRRESCDLVRKLAERESAPKNIQLTAVSGGYFASIFDEVEYNAPISDRVTIGFSQSPALAVLKGLTEWLERLAFREGVAKGLASCQTARSDGIAAFPLALGSVSDARRKARSNAYAEAVERYVWSIWWDRVEIGYERLTADAIIPQAGLCFGLLTAARDLVPIDRIEVLTPHIESRSGKAAVVIILAHMANGGVLTGGAAGDPDEATVWERAAADCPSSEFLGQAVA